MLLFTDFKRIARGCLARERIVSVNSDAEKKLRLVLPPCEQPNIGGGEVTMAWASDEVSVAHEVPPGGGNATFPKSSSIPQAKGRRGSVTGTRLRNTDVPSRIDVVNAIATSPPEQDGIDAAPDSSPVKQRVPKVSKASFVLHLLEREPGATLPELLAATGWQAHSVRGFLSGTVRKKLGLNLISAADTDGSRRYRIASNDDGAKPENPDRPNTVVDNLSPDPTQDETTPTEPLAADVTTNEPVS